MEESGYHMFGQRWRHLAGMPLLVSLALAGCQQGGGSSTPAGTSTPPGTATGCGHPATSAGQSVVATLTSGGLSRTYRLHVPVGYRSDQPVPVVFVFHGHTSTDEQQEAYSRFSPLADQQGFIAVYPQGTIGPDDHTGWATYGQNDPTVDDVGFTRDLLNKLEATLCVDAHRIFATGISNGGGMTMLLACKLADRFAAFAPVAGAFYPIPGGCTPSRPVPILDFHGTADPLVHYDGAPRLGFPPIPIWLQDWATRDGCTSGPTVFFQQADVTGERWSQCQAAGAVSHYRIDGGGHTWPGAVDVPLLGMTTHTIDATTLMWQFFRQHPLPGA